MAVDGPADVLICYRFSVLPLAQPSAKSGRDGRQESRRALSDVGSLSSCDLSSDRNVDANRFGLNSKH
uniref:Uncharacterized protein n=1 Tax=Chromera velia CCMP2878 TaxID=1169474 RepID=A0A0G4FK98_9ALVE|eukprot:Cvel_17469.t1-p1 / transcript=Cvel_17469.t1 / gene=Cvel_17469 / organism=Chromera_velia_CCMP2878 / gene_product=hypothetical protein / transcript_product=hypothetical protein / location=Cvel_scaffold1395:46298-46957(+) / protein_length=67 / sequence_SO=supercontig / SO=protein_coding / is_pseudo=false